MVAEIEGAGGEAVADPSDVAAPEGGAAVVQRALDRFGRIDVVVANAGIIRWAALPELDAADLDAHLAVHLGGSFHVTRAAWPHLVGQGYGRVVLTASTGVLGLPQNAAYAAAKGGVIGLARSLATAGARHGIRVNCIAPAASTRMAGDGGPDLPPELAAPMVAYLASEACPVTGEVLVAGGGRFARLLLATTDGWVHEGDGAPTVDDLAAHWSEVMATDGWTAPPDLLAWSARFLSHLGEGA